MGTDIATVILLFPLLVPVWQQGPFYDTDLVPGPYPINVEAEKIHVMREGFRYVDYAMRTRMVQNLGRSASPVAATALLEHMERETDDRVVATILGQLANLPYDPAAARAAAVPLLEHSDPGIRFFAVNLYGALPGASPATLIEIAGNDPEARIRRKAAARLRRHAGRFGVDDIDHLCASQDSIARAEAWAAACYAVDAGVHGRRFLRAAEDEEDPGVRYAMASHLSAVGLPAAFQALQALAGDSHASVRCATATAIGTLADDSLLPALLTLTRDEDSEVRRLAVASLAAFPGEPAAEAIVKAYGDATVFVREEAEETAVAIHSEHPMADLTVAELRQADPNIRLRSYNVLGRIGADAYRGAIGAALVNEHDSVLIAAALKALYRLGDTDHEELILSFADHDAEIVRANAVLAMGNLRSREVLGAVRTLIADSDSEVRRAALHAAGRIADPYFAPVFLNVLRSTGERSIYSSRHRSYACWGAARIRPVNDQLAQRLVEQATTPVIPVMGMRMFEPDYVLATAAFALAEIARDVPDVMPLAERVITAHSRVPTPDDLRNQGPGDLVPSAELREAARQAEAHLRGEDVAPQPRPTRTISMIYRELAR